MPRLLQRQNEAAIATRERMRLARDLHDGILQSLTAAALQLSLVEKKSGPSSRLDMVKQLLAKEQHRIREFVDKTCPKAVSDRETVLSGDLQQLVQNTGRYWNCTTSFSITPRNATVPHALAEQLSFALAEAIANAARHGGASMIEVAMKRENGHLDISIRDNGKGFGDPVRCDHKEPISIRERVCTLGGSLSVTSSPDGTELAIRVPHQEGSA
jgi:signal transduction histidine kinase